MSVIGPFLRSGLHTEFGRVQRACGDVKNVLTLRDLRSMKQGRYERLRAARGEHLIIARSTANIERFGHDPHSIDWKLTFRRASEPRVERV